MPATITVTGIGDDVTVDGLVTLREALQSANGNANINADVVGVGAYGIDTIQFDSVLFSAPQVITSLTTELLVSDSVSIVGTSSANVTIDGGAKDRVFHVEKTGSQIVVSFKNMTIQGGKATSNLTGGVDGGGIYVHDEDVTIDSCVIQGNIGDEGGGVTVNGAGAKLTITNTSLTSNSAATAAAGGDGGGLNIEAAATVTVTNCTMSGNFAAGQGGGFYSTGAVNATFTGATITSNNTGATAAGAGGGGGYFFGSVGNSTLTMSGCTVSTNLNGGAVDGGGIAVTGSANLTTTFTLSGSTIDGNTTGRNGGGLAISGFVATTITDSTLSNNSNINGSGGGINLSGTAVGSGFLLRNSTISGHANAINGGGVRIAVAFGNFSIQNCTITNNTAKGSGGGILDFAGRHTLSLQSTIVAGNSAPVFGNDLSSNLVVTAGNSAIGSLGGYTLNDLGGNLAPGAALNLMPLAANGGLTMTHLPGPGSPLRDTGSNPGSVAFDQRGTGFPRVVGGIADIGAVESVDATGIPVATATLPTQTGAGVSTYTAVVVYTDDVGINVGSIDVNDLTLSGTGVTNPTPISVTTVGAGTKVTATYKFAAPDNVGLASWDVSDNGTFTVSLNPSEVTDGAANPVPSGQIGLFRAAITQKFMVTNTTTAGAGSLAQAISDANSSPNTQDTIEFDVSLSGKTIILGGELLVTDPVTIKGLGSGVLTIDGGANGRIFHTQGDGITTLNLSGMKLTNAKRLGLTPSDRGGAIFSEDDPVSLTDMIITGNTSENDGAGVALGGGNTLTIVNSVISNNSATGTFGDAGGVFANNGPVVLIQNSTVSGNSSFFSGAGVYFVNGKVTIDSSTISGNTSRGTTATYSGGGGVYFVGSFNDILITNSTISNNIANFNGGGILFRSSGSVYNTFKIQNSTIASNRAYATTANPGTSSGGGIAVTGVIFTDINLESSIVAGNTGTLPDFSQSGAVNTKNSAIGSKTGAAGVFNDLGGNLIGATLNLGTLASNGGATQTHLPAAGSVLINAGSNPGFLTNDQRGATFSRTVGGTADIGAVDSDGLNPVSIAGPFADINAVGGTSYDFVVTYVDDTAIKVATVDANDIVITGPGGFTANATVKVAPVGGDGTPRSATYTFTPPGGSWNGADNGFYKISINGGQVSDTGGAFVAAGTLGNFRVNTPLSLVVNATNDEAIDTDTLLSLREAILAANAVTGLDVISFDPAVFNGTSTIGLTLGAIIISDDVTLNGLGTTKVVVDAAGNGNKRIFRINNSVTGSHITVNVVGMKLQNAANSEAPAPEGTARGGAVYIQDEFVSFTDCEFANNSSTAGGGAIAANGSGGKLTLTRVLFSGNSETTASGGGGAIRITTTVDLTVTDSTFTGNKSRSSGGAIAVVGGGALIVNSTFSANEAGTAADTTSSFGGAVFFSGAPPQFGWTVRNSTLTGNKSRGSGGAIFDNGAATSGGQLLLQNCTMTGNTSAAFQDGVNTVGGGGGGLGLQYAGVIFRIENSIIVGNFTNNLTPVANDVRSVTNDQIIVSYSAIGTNPNFVANTLVDLGNNLFGVLPASLQLDTLKSNGGNTQTIALLPGSVAIDAGSNTAGSANDQAGQTRVIGTRADIGAFESQAVADLPTANVTLPAEVTAAGATTFVVVVDYTDKTGVDGTTIDVNDITVKGGFFGVTPVSPTGVTTSGSGSKITATYTFAAPSGAFANATNGTYTVTLKGGQVADTNTNAVFAADTDFGNFRSAIGKTINVTSGADTGAGTLRQAIADANGSVGVDTITFDAGVTLVTLSSAELLISEGVVIQGNGSGSTKVNQTKAATRVFRILTPGIQSVTFDKLTISGGIGVSGPAIFFYDEAVTVSNSAISGNTATGNGAITVQEGGNLTIINSLISANSASGAGGGVFVNRNLSNVIVQDSTISGNTSAGSGGGIYHNYGGSLLVAGSTFTGNIANGANGGGGIGFGNRISGAGFVVRNSTFTANTALNHGGAIVFTTSLQGTAFIQNSTISKNSAPNGSAAQGNSGGGVAWRLSVVGVAANFAQISFDSTIVAGNTGNNPDVSTQNLVVANKSLIGVGDTGFVITGAGNLTGTKATPLDPLLDVLASNGGPTQTLALKAGSPAINTGSNVGLLATDQRGVTFARLSGGAVDIGAYEIQVATPSKVTNVKINSLKTGVDQTQRSRVTDVAITFDSAVSFTGGAAAAFTLNKVGGGSVTLAASVDVTNTIVTLTFTGGAVDNISLADGRYALHALAAQFAGAGLDGDGNGTGGDDFLFDEPAGPATLDTTKIFRLYGDINGDGTVAASDFIQFRLALGGTSFGFDFDNDGAVATSDFIQFRLRFGGSI